MYYKKAAITAVSTVAAASAVVAGNSIFLTSPAPAKSFSPASVSAKQQEKTKIRVLKVQVPKSLLRKSVQVQVKGPKGFLHEIDVYTTSKTIFVSVPSRGYYSVSISAKDKPVKKTTTIPAIDKEIPDVSETPEDNNKNIEEEVEEEIEDEEGEDEDEDEEEEDDDDYYSPTPSQSSSPSQSPAPTQSSPPANNPTDGTFLGSIANPGYGDIQVQITVAGGKLTAVKTVKYPVDISTSARINKKAVPILEASALSSNGTSVTAVSGATYTYNGFKNSLKTALSKAGL